MTPFDQVDHNLRAQGALTLDEFIPISAHWVISKEDDDQQSPTSPIQQPQELDVSFENPASATVENSTKSQPLLSNELHDSPMSTLFPSFGKTEVEMDEGSLRLLYPDQDPLPQAQPGTKNTHEEIVLDPSSQAIKDACVGVAERNILPKWQVYSKRDKEDPDRMYSNVFCTLLPNF